MRLLLKLSVVLFTMAMLPACGSVEDKDGNNLQVGSQYLMTEDGLAPVPYPADRQGNPLEVGREYVMTPAGLSLVPYLEDIEGARVEVGNEYVMTGQGLKLVLSRGIKGTIQDYAGKPVAGVEVVVSGADAKTVSKQDGSFTLPFIEGYVRLSFRAADLPEWCTLADVETMTVNRERYPDGWDLGTVNLPCTLAASGNGKTAWATADGSCVDNGDGTISDLRHGLMWEAEVKHYGISWNDAEQYAADLALAQQSDWRLPSLEELEALNEAAIACAWNGPTLIRGASSLWTSEHVEDAALVYNVCSGKNRKSSGLDEGPNVNPGVLAVRRID